MFRGQWTSIPEVFRRFSASFFLFRGFAAVILPQIVSFCNCHSARNVNFSSGLFSRNVIFHKTCATRYWEQSPRILMLRRREARRNLFNRAPRPQPPWEGRAPARPHGEPPSWRLAAADGTAALPRIAPSACTTAYCNPAEQSRRKPGLPLRSDGASRLRNAGRQ